MITTYLGWGLVGFAFGIIIYWCVEVYSKGLRITITKTAFETLRIRIARRGSLLMTDVPNEGQLSEAITPYILNIRKILENRE